MNRLAGPTIAEHLREQNPWWLDGAWDEKDAELGAWRSSPLRCDPRLRREIEYHSEPSNTTVYSVRGPLGAGKTTMIKMQIRDLIAGGACPWNVAYCSFDLGGEPADVAEAVKAYLALSRRRRDGRRSFLFLDELSNVLHWQKGVKWLVDAGFLRDFTVVTAGSTSADIRKATELMPGRRGRVAGGHDRILFPMGFGDFACMMDGDVRAILEGGRGRDGLLAGLLGGKIGEAVDRLSAHRPALDRLLAEYAVTGGLPAVVNAKAASGRIPDGAYADCVGRIAEQWKRASGSEASLGRLAGAVAESEGRPFSWSQFAKDASLGGAGAAAECVQTLQDMFVLHVLHGYGAAGMPDANGRKKAYFGDPFVRHAFGAPREGGGFGASLRRAGGEPGMGSIVEGAVCDCLVRLALRSGCNFLQDYSDRLFYWQDGEGRELDFVLRTPEYTAPVDVRFGQTLGGRDLAPVARFLDEASAEKGLVVSKSALEEKADCAVVPACIFLLGA